jgi:hypothetical protein
VGGSPSAASVEKEGRNTRGFVGGGSLDLAIARAADVEKGENGSYFTYGKPV